MIDFITLLRRIHADGLSDNQLGREAGVDPSAIWRWRNGRRSPNLAKVNDVLAAIERLGFGDTYTALPVVAGAAGGGRRGNSTPSLAARPCSNGGDK